MSYNFQNVLCSSVLLFSYNVIPMITVFFEDFSICLTYAIYRTGTNQKFCNSI